jgi:hypothetical protein
MSGPALAGEGIDQDDVDALLSGSSDEMPAAEMSAQDLADDLFAQADVEETGAEAEEEPTVAAIPERPETNLSDEDVDRLMGADGPANDALPGASVPVEPDDRTPEQLVRAVESLLAEEANEDVSMAIDAEKGTIKKVKPLSILDATNDDEDEPAEEPTAAEQERAAASSGSKAKTTTQADIDALFS